MVQRCNSMEEINMIKEGTALAERQKRMIETLRTIYNRSKKVSETKGQKRLRDFEKVG